MTESSPVVRGDDTRRIALVDLLDRVLGGGVVITGDITLSLADVDMVKISLRTLIASVSALEPHLSATDAADDR
ncbi:putative gas vesicle synthesis protein GvpS [Gordonia namibiensis NBRC 108229]|uniref:Putative gas vesicle synthesis protein GvpS n=1 Tax=Gordonia namibiensis NBRC 108229 TaxID=1208314 RepID=K6WQ24_9ACTN|nr:gas vesicle protein [Gordonia namibiensis]GAC01526.1 putative gas vesicle synthesis protein GvpS [Gordonia namibiensis NBRC 108229]